MKRLIPVFAVLLLVQIACQFPTLTSVSPTPLPTSTLPLTNTPLPTNTPMPTHTPLPTSEQLNMGTHRYWRETISAGCDANENSQGADYVDKTHNFSPDFAAVEYGGNQYQQTGLHRYESINESDKPLVLIYSDLGFDLEVYQPGEDTRANPPCLIFRFRFDY